MKLRNSMVVVNSDNQQQGGSPSSCWWKFFLRKIDWSSIDKKYFAPRNVDWKAEFSNNFLTIYERCSSAKKFVLFLYVFIHDIVIVFLELYWNRTKYYITYSIHRFVETSTVCDFDIQTKQQEVCKAMSCVLIFQY